MEDIRETWEKAKKEALKVLPKGFFTGADLGKLLDKAKTADSYYTKLPGTADPAKVQEARRAASEAYVAAAGACDAYLKLVSMAQKSPTNQNNAPLLRALDKASTALGTNIKGELVSRHLKLRMR